MKVLIVHNRYQIAGGEDVVVAAEAAMLREGGVEVEMAEVSNDAIVSLPSKLRTLAQTPYGPARRAWMRERVRAAGADVVHIHNFFPLLTPAIHDGAADAGAAVVQTLHNYRLLCANGLLLRGGVVCEDCVGRVGWPAIRHRCYRGSAAGSAAVVAMQQTAWRRGTWRTSVDRFIVLTDFARDIFVRGGIGPERIVVKANAVAVPSPPTDVRAGLLFVGRLSREKGLDTLLAAMRALPDVALTIAGDGPARSDLIPSAPPNVSFLGQVDRATVQRLMAATTLMVMPSIWYEGMPMTLLEANSLATPVAASRIGALAELIDDGETGWLFPAGDATALAGLLRRLTADLAELRRVGLRARQVVADRNSLSRNFSELTAIYASALDQRGRVRGA